MKIILPVHPKPSFEKTVGEWIESLAEANFIGFKEMFLYIVKYAKDGGLVRGIYKLTKINLYNFSLKNEFKPRIWKRIWKNPKFCPVFGCEEEFNSVYYLFEHMKSKHSLGDGWFKCIRCGKKIKEVSKLGKHLYSKHKISLVNPDEIKDKSNYPYIDMGKIIENIKQN